MYTRRVKKYSGYDTIKDARKRARANKKVKNTAHLTDKKIVMAIAQSYRNSVDPTMDNETLSKELERINSVKDLNTLNAQEIRFKVMMESAKMNFKYDDKAISEILKKG